MIRFLLLSLLTACAVSDTRSNPIDSADTADSGSNVGAMPKMRAMSCDLVGAEFQVNVGTDDPPAYVLWVGAAFEDGSIGWRIPSGAVSYRDGILRTSITSNETECRAWIQ